VVSQETSGGSPPGKGKWHQSIAFMVGALVILGPFALPLVWTNHNLKLWIKLAITLSMILLTALLYYAGNELNDFTQVRLDEMKQIRESF